MSERTLVVIGGDAAGISAASKVRRTHPDRRIVVFERGAHTSYAACGMPYLVAGQVKSPDHLVARSPEVIQKKMKVDVHTRHEVTSIDTAGKRVVGTNLETGEQFSESYDDLLIATGASPIRPGLPGMDAQGVFGLSTLQTGIDIYEDIQRIRPKKAVVVGGGYIGIEMAEALLARGMEVTLIDMADQVMPTMDADMASLISEYMKSEGVNVHLGERLTRIEAGEDGGGTGAGDSPAAGGTAAPGSAAGGSPGSTPGRVTAVVTDARRIECDIVALGMGVRANSELAKNAGIAVGDSGAIAVNKRLETSEPNVWAAGDCAESYHRIANKQVFIALGTVANKHGVVAGINLSGGSAEFPGVLGTAITKMNDLEIARTGLSEREATAAGIEYRTATIESETRAGYYPGGGKITVKLVVEAESGRLLGGQITGMQGAGKRIDTIATAVTAGMTASEVMNLDLSYAPPFSPVWDPVQTAARRLV